MTPEWNMDAMLETIQQLIDAQQPGMEPGTITLGEFVKSSGFGPAKARKVLHQLRDEGKVEPAWVTRLDAWGSRGRVKGWRVTS